MAALPVAKRSLWTGNSDADLMDTDNHLLLVSSCSLLLGDSAEYSKLTDYGKIKKDAITELLQKLLTKVLTADNLEIIKDYYICQDAVMSADSLDRECYECDSSGAQFDKNGNMVNWWTDEDYAAFKERNNKLAAYYNNMHPWEGQDFLGDIMTGEAGADMAGMKAILIMAKDKKDFDYDKLFRAVGDVWLTKGTLQDAYAQINNEHPMAYLRVNCTLQQFDEFLDFYDIKEGDAMYLAPEDRVIVW